MPADDDDRHRQHPSLEKVPRFEELREFELKLESRTL
jgi:hypothetical protein